MLVRVTVAGRVGIEVGGVHTGEAGLGRLGRLALAYLVCERHRPVARDELAEVLWGEDLPASWEQLLRGQASKLRATFGQAGLDPGGTLTSALGAYQVHLPPGAVLDVDEAAANVEAAGAALAGGNPAEARRRAAAAKAVAARQFLPAASGAWVERRQAELREVHLRALEVLVRAAAEDGLWGEAIDAAEEAIAIEPFRESAYLALMAAHAAAGSRGEAIRAYERCRRVLAEELGVRPSPATEEAFLDLLGDEPAPVSEEVTPSAPLRLPPALVGLAGGVVVGRESDAERLTAALERATAKGRQAVFVGGEPGIGKTTLVAAFAAEAHRQGARVLYGRCDEELGLSYQPFAEALSGFVADAPMAELALHAAAHGGELARLAPELTRRLSDVTVPPSTDPEGDRYWLFDAVTSMLKSAAARAPVVLILDDLHWAAPPTLVLLRHLLRATADAALLVVGTYRHTDVGPDHPLTQTLADLHREPAVDRLVLQGLDGDGVGAFLQAARGGTPSDDDVPLVRALHVHTAGNPFFVGQLLQHLGETGATYRREGTWSYYADIEDLGIPEGVREVVGRRLQRLSEPTREVLRWGAVIGTEFGLDVLDQVEGLAGMDALLDAVDDAVQSHLAAERGASRYRFTHALVRDTIYAELTLTRRAQWHRRVAEALELLPVDDAHRLPALVHHFAAAASAGGAPRAADYALAASRQALTHSAWEDALAFLERGLQALAAAEPPDLERRCDLLLVVAETWCRVWEPPRALPAATEAVATARSLGDPERMANAARWYITGQTRPDPATITVADEALAALGDRRPDLRAILLARLAPPKRFAGDMTRDALDLARRSGSRDALGVALLMRSVDLGFSGQAVERLEVAEELVTAAPPDGWDGWRGGHEQRAAARIAVGDRAGFEADAAACERIGREKRFWFYRARAALWRGTSALLDGRFDEVEALVEEFRAVATASVGPSAPRDLPAIQLVRLALDRGTPMEAETILTAGLEQSPGHGVLASMLALADAELGKVDRARASLDRFAGDEPRRGAAPLSAELAYLAEVADALVDRRHAARLYDRLHPLAGQMVAAGAVAHCPGAVDRYLGLLAATLGRLDAADVHFAEALRLEAGMRSPPLLARTRLRYGGMLLDRGAPGDAAESRRLLEEALATAERLGMASVAAQAADLAGTVTSRRSLYASSTGVSVQ